MSGKKLDQNFYLKGYFFAREAFNSNLGFFLCLLSKNEAAQLCTICVHFLYFLPILQTLLGWWNACGFLTSVAKQNSPNLLKFGWLLVACLCGSFSLSFVSKTLGGISVSDLNQNVFLIGKLITEIKKDSKRKKEKTVTWTIQFVHFPLQYFPDLTKLHYNFAHNKHFSQNIVSSFVWMAQPKHFLDNS